MSTLESDSTSTNNSGRLSGVRNESSFSGNVWELVLGTAIASLLTVAVSPLLTRLFSPEAFGRLALFISILGITAIVVCLRYEQAIVLTEDDGEAVNVCVVCVCVSLLTSALLGLAIVLGKPVFASWLKDPEFEPYLWLVPFATLVNGLYAVLRYWSTRMRQFACLKSSGIVVAASTSMFQVGAGLIGWTTGLALIWGWILGLAAGSGMLLQKAWGDNFGLIRHSVSLDGSRAMLHRYRKFPLFGSWGALLNAVSFNAPVFLLSAFFSPAIVGYYALANRIVNLPLRLIGQSISQVFLERAASARSEGSLSQIVEKITYYMIRLELFPILVLAVTGGDIFHVVFGSEWQEAGSYLQILSLLLLARFVASPLGMLFTVLEKQESELLLNLLFLGARVGSLIVGGMLQSVVISLWLLSISGALIYGYMVFKTMQWAEVRLDSIMQIVMVHLLLSLPGVSALLVLKYFKTPSWFLMSIAVVFVGVYLLYVAWKDPLIREQLKKSALPANLMRLPWA